jgi:hypothetical protein
MGQTRKQSLMESFLNILIGYSLNFTMNMIFLPLFGFDIKVSQNLLLGAIFTGISLTRSYLIRRWFNKERRGCPNKAYRKTRANSLGYKHKIRRTL